MSPQKRGVKTKINKYKVRVVLRGDIVKDETGADADCTEHGSSASQMTAAKVMDVIARLPDCDEEAADAVSAYTQVKLVDAPRLLKIPKSECPYVWIRLPRHKWPKFPGKHWRSCGTPRTNLKWTPLGRTVVGKTIRGSSIGTWMGRSTK